VGASGRIGQSTPRGERYIFESRLVVCPPPTRTHPPSCPPKEINHSINRRRIERRPHLHRFAPPSSSTSTPWATSPKSSSRRGVARVHPSSRVSSTNRLDSMCRDSTRASANDRGEPRVADGTIDNTTSSTILHCTPYRVSTGTDDDAVFY